MEDTRYKGEESEATSLDDVRERGIGRQRSTYNGVRSTEEGSTYLITTAVTSSSRND